MYCLVITTSSTATTAAFLPAATKLDTSAIPGWAIGLIVTGAVLGALALVALLAATVAIVLWVLKR